MARFTDKKIRSFRRLVLGHYRAHKRSFPWRKTRDPYKILVSELMLQQTQTNRVEQKYGAFLRRFPTIRSLARAPFAAVLRKWQGLGYNRRALLLHRMSKTIVAELKGRVPRSQEALERLPGVGTSTAGAVRAFAFNLPAVFIETNIRRAFIHYFFLRAKRVPDTDILPLLDRAVRGQAARIFYSALMDYGAMLGQQKENPNRRSRHHARQSAFQGSNRELRGRIIKLLSTNDRAFSSARVARLLADSPARVTRALASLSAEGFLHKRGDAYSVQK